MHRGERKVIFIKRLVINSRAFTALLVPGVSTITSPFFSVSAGKRASISPLTRDTLDSTRYQINFTQEARSCGFQE